MKLRIFNLLFLVGLFFHCGMHGADCGLPKSEVRNQKYGISRDAAIKLFTDANEKYLQATKFIASKKNTGGRSAPERGGNTIRDNSGRRIQKRPNLL